jgi:cytochrome b561
MSTNRNIRYHPFQVSLHWLVVILIIAAFLLGKSMSGLPNEPAKTPLLALHMLLGLTTLIVIVLRLIARVRLPRPASATTGNAFLDWVGKAVHYALYLLVFLMALSGMSLSLQSGLLPAVFGVPGAALPADFFEFSARMLHGFIAPALLVLIFIHAGAALYHQFALKDNLLSRMWYGKPAREEPR